LSHAVFSELAEGDLAEIWVSIALDNIENADRFIEELRDKAAQLFARIGIKPRSARRERLWQNVRQTKHDLRRKSRPQQLLWP
jgi:plasmid stabilization system protein ParE